MKILLIDGQGGKIGKELAEAIFNRFPFADITAVGTNTIATSSMIKAGVKNAATGENAVVVCCRKADIIVGPIGIVVADSLLGEITPKMAVAVAQSDAVKILIPSDKCSNIVVGVKKTTMSELISDAVEKITEIINGKASETVKC